MRRGGLVGLLLALASAAAAQGPSADWRTVETAHFRVHFPAPFEAWARHAAGQLEPIHARVAALVGFSPDRPIEVVVSDPAADANGAAAPFLDRPEILLWTSPPGTASELGDFRDWTEMLATHEVAHVVHLARPAPGWRGFLSRISPAPFGPLALGSPRWLIEGYATFVEGALTGSGRPASSFRAMVLRGLAVDGKLPPYAKLDGGDGWLSDAMPYLVGSAYLEWLVARAGPASLPDLWRRMALRFAGGFNASFREVYGDSPEDLYDRFVAESSARALDEEKRLKAAGLVEGDLVLSLEGSTLSPQVSPDGSKLLVRRDPSRRVSLLSVWDLAPQKTERAPLRTLPRLDGYSPADPRWMPDGRRVLFSRRAPDADGVLRRDLYLWGWERGSVGRVTRRADVSQADPSPDGLFAVAVRSRFGATTLVRVDLATGETREIPCEGLAPEDWPVWAEPRLSPDGTRIAALLHRDARWRLVVLPSGGGAMTEIAVGGAAAAAPAWSPDGSTIFVTADGSGTWNVVAAPADGGPAARVRTRVTGGAFAPAPSPDGRSLYFLDWTARGVDVRRLDLAAAPPSEEEPLVPPRREPAPPMTAEPATPDRPYSVWPSQIVRPLLNFSIGPDGDTVQLGVDGGDVLGRLHWLAAGSVGNTPGPRGGAIAAAWRGLPFMVSLQLFSALEKPGRQSLAPRPALDVERRGGYFEAAWARAFDWGRLEADGGEGVASYDALATGRDFGRALGNARLRAVYRRTRGRWGGGIDLEAAGSVGETDGRGWSQAAGNARLFGVTPIGTFSAGARWGDTGGRPTRFDVFTIGGSPSTILPPGFDRNRIESRALPYAVQLGEKFEAYRAEAEASAWPLVLYGEWLRAWNPGFARPDPVRVAGAEARLERLIPAEFGRSISFRVGAAWIQSAAPRFDTVRGYADLIFRP